MTLTLQHIESADTVTGPDKVMGPDMTEAFQSPVCRLHVGDGPIVATALHCGLELSAAAAGLLALSESERGREEDAITPEWAEFAGTRVLGLRSRFEVDFDRPRSEAVPLTPKDAGGLAVWRRPPGRHFVQESQAAWDSFYLSMSDLLSEIQRRHLSFVVIDLRIDHRRSQDTRWLARPAVAISVETQEPALWADPARLFVGSLREFDIDGGPLQVSEEPLRHGGHWPRWISRQFGPYAICFTLRFSPWFVPRGNSAGAGLRAREAAGLLRFSTAALLPFLER